VMAIGAADPPQPLERMRIADTAAERVTGVGRIGNHAPLAQDRRCAPNQSRLRILAVQLEILAHGLRTEGSFAIISVSVDK
jgi:hypothetical protein